MNERIQAFAEQAGQESFDSEHTALLQVSTEHTMYEVPAGFIVKFSELIVQECADIAKHNVMNISTYADAEFVDTQIKQHFGVEE